MAAARTIIAAAALSVLGGCAGKTVAPTVAQPLTFDRSAPMRFASVTVDAERGVWG